MYYNDFDDYTLRRHGGTYMRSMVQVTVIRDVFYIYNNNNNNNIVRPI